MLSLSSLWTNEETAIAVPAHAAKAKYVLITARCCSCPESRKNAKKKKNVGKNVSFEFVFDLLNFVNLPKRNRLELHCKLLIFFIDHETYVNKNMRKYANLE